MSLNENNEIVCEAGIAGFHEPSLTDLAFPPAYPFEDVLEPQESHSLAKNALRQPVSVPQIQRQDIRDKFAASGARAFAGGFGEVKRINNRAVKVQPLANGKALREARALYFLAGCETLQRVEDAFVDAESKTLYLVSKWEGNTTLLEYARDGVSEEDLSCIMEHVLQAVSHLHTKGVMHFDVKPNNIVIGEKAVLIDLGNATTLEELAASADEEGMAPCPLTNSAFTSPFVDVANKHRISVDNAKRADLYALGLTAVYGFVGDSEFRGNADPIPQALQTKRASPKLMDFLKCLLVPGHVSPSSGVVLTAGDLLRHPFITKPSKQEESHGDCDMEMHHDTKRDDLLE